jgi:hypothetical protein
MRLDAKRERELARRKGLALRTILAVIWLGLCFVAAYYLVNYLFEIEVFTWGLFRLQLRIPYSVSDLAIQIGAMVVVVVAINFVVLVIFGLFSATGRRRPGTPSLYSAEPDPDDRKYDYR